MAKRTRSPKTSPRRTARSSTKKTPARRAKAARASRAKARATAAPAPKTKTRTLRLFQVDAFTGRLFHGNAAGVVVLKQWLAPEVMQSIAAENNLSETAFVVPTGKQGRVARFGIRWFTPAVEVDLCGHATLASAHVLWEHLKLRADRIAFESPSGTLGVHHEDGIYELDFPARAGERVNNSRALARVLGREPAEVFKDRDYLAVFENRRDVHELDPDFGAIAAMSEVQGIVVTAPGSGHDFVSRYFAPRAGVDEDPATGSTHCMLVPYWAARLKRPNLTSHQVSRRGGEFFCEHRGDRVGIAGRCVTYLDGSIRVPA